MLKQNDSLLLTVFGLMHKFKIRFLWIVVLISDIDAYIYIDIDVDTGCEGEG